MLFVTACAGFVSSPDAEPDMTQRSANAQGAPASCDAEDASAKDTYCPIAQSALESLAGMTGVQAFDEDSTTCAELAGLIADAAIWLYPDVTAPVYNGQCAAISGYTIYLSYDQSTCSSSQYRGYLAHEAAHVYTETTDDVLPGQAENRCG